MCQCLPAILMMSHLLPVPVMVQVVIKSTRRWCPKADGQAACYQEYDRCTCLQMIGRAGRPQYDLEGTAVIMTERSVIFFEFLGSSCI